MGRNNVVQEETNEFGFTGIWIPKELLDIPGLKLQSKTLLSIIHALDKGNKKGTGCFATNEYLADKIEIVESRVRQLIQELRKKNLIIDAGFDGRRRYLKVNWEAVFHDQGDRILSGRVIESYQADRYNLIRQGDRILSPYSKVDKKEKKKECLGDSGESPDDPNEMPNGISTDHHQTHSLNNRLNKGSILNNKSFNSPKSNKSNKSNKSSKKSEYTIEYELSKYWNEFKDTQWGTSSKFKSKLKEFLQCRREREYFNRPNASIKIQCKWLFEKSNGDVSLAITQLEEAISRGWKEFIYQDSILTERFNGSKNNGTNGKPSNFYESKDIAHEGIIPRKLEQRVLANLDKYFHEWYLDDVQENVSFGDDKIKTLRQAFEANICDVCDPKTFESKGDDWKKYRKFPKKTKSGI